MIEKHLLQQDDSFEMESKQIQTWIEESGKKPGLLLVNMKKLEHTILSMLETLKGTGQQKAKMDENRKPVPEEKDGQAA